MVSILSFARYVITLFNLPILIAAVILIGYGVLLVRRGDAVIEIFGNTFSLGGLAIGIGVFVFMVAYLGCRGAIDQDRCMLTTYGIILLVLCVIQMVLGFVAIVQIPKDEQIRMLVQELFANGQSNDLQETYKCCGVDGKQDYSNSRPYFYYSYPSSCCKGNTSPCYEPYEQGCAKAIADSSIGIIVYAPVGLAAVEFLGAILAFMIKSRLNHPAHAPKLA